MRIPFALGWVLLCFAAAPVRAQESPQEQPSKYLTAWAHQGEEEIREFRRRGGPASSPGHPGRQWATRFWEYRAAHAGTPAATQAVSEALWMWLAAEQWPALRDAAETLALNDSAWIDSFRPLLLAADAQKDYTWFDKKLAAITASCLEKNVCSRAWMFRAHGFARQQKHGEAEVAAARAVALASPAWHAKAAAAFDEITRLSPGLPAPQFSAKSLDGKTITLADYRGKVVLLNFWASW